MLSFKRNAPDSPLSPTPVSYTHLDVYKRQALYNLILKEEEKKIIETKMNYCVVRLLRVAEFCEM